MDDTIIAMNGDVDVSKPTKIPDTIQSTLNTIAERDEIIQTLQKYKQDLETQQQKQTEQLCENATKNELLNFVLEEYKKDLQMSIQTTQTQIDGLTNVKDDISKMMESIPEENFTALETFTQNIDELERNIDALNTQLEGFKTQLQSIQSVSTDEGQSGGRKLQNKKYKIRLF